jgi:hypothetical protein
MAQRENSCFALLAVSASSFFAQTFGEITGTVMDSSNSVLPGAVVTVRRAQLAERFYDGMNGLFSLAS